ncbi:hypothetical protein [Bradyrhizobium diazoefficiens]|uniref:hypothetical protein n=1 Tax=Bradyrhizobium diazoefficiens TaxID=1355477 RepID=UPI00348838C2
MPHPTAVANFKSSPLGRELAPLIETDAVVLEMITINAYGLPPVCAVGRRLSDDLKAKISDSDKRMIGAWVAEVLAPRGWVPSGVRQLDRKKWFFSSGAMYVEKGATLAA